MPKPSTAQRPAPRRADSGAGARRELKYYGLAACEALWRRRPEDVIRIYLEERLIPRFTPLLKRAAAQRKAYHIVGPEDLARLTESIHHQGICVLAREAPPLPYPDLLTLLREVSSPELVIYLDDVENPHNLGAIMRNAAHFGVRFVLGPQNRLPRLSPSACRVAEGGAEHVALVPLARPDKQLLEIQQLGYALVAGMADKGVSLYGQALPVRSVLIMSAEMAGISSTLLNSADALVRIPGSGVVNGLNIAVACGVIVGEHFRQHCSPPRRRKRPRVAKPRK